MDNLEEEFAKGMVGESSEPEHEVEVPPDPPEEVEAPLPPEVDTPESA